MKIDTIKTSTRSPSQLILLIGLCIILISLIAYLPLYDCDFFAWDDGEYVTDNPHVITGLSFENIKWAFTTGYLGNWHPVTWLSHMTDVSIFGVDPQYHHLTNLFIHIANALLLFYILLKMSDALWESAFVAVLFAIHPLHVESVAWISERKDVLSTFWAFLTLLSYFYYVKRPNWKNYLLILSCFTLALMSKAMVVTLPFVMLLLDYWPLNRISFPSAENTTPLIRRLVSEKIPLFLLSIILAIITFYTQQTAGMVKEIPLDIRLANGIVSYIKYVVKMFLPINLGVMYPYTANHLWDWPTLGALLLIMGSLYFSIRLAKRHPYGIVGIGWYMGTLIPVIGFVRLGEFSMADRYTYVPMIGLLIVLGWGISAVTRSWSYRKIILFGGSGILLSLCVIGTYFQVSYWKNSISLYEHTLNVTQNNCLVHNDLGQVLARKGDLDEAINHYQKAIDIWPAYAKAHKNLGDVFFTRGAYGTAESYYRQAIECLPDYIQAYSNLAQLLVKQGKLNEAVFLLERALQIDSEQDWLHVNLAMVLSTMKQYDRAAAHFTKALDIDSENADTRFKYGQFLQSIGKLQPAMSQLAEVIRIQPDNAAAYYQVGKIFIISGDLERARSFIEQAIKLNPELKEARVELIKIGKMGLKDGTIRRK